MLDEVELINDMTTKLEVAMLYGEGDIDKILPQIDIDQLYETGKKAREERKEEYEKLKEKCNMQNIDDEWTLKIASTIKSLQTISRLLQTKKLQDNKKDLIKVSKEVAKISARLLEMGSVDE